MQINVLVDRMVHRGFLFDLEISKSKEFSLILKTTGSALNPGCELWLQKKEGGKLQKIKCKGFRKPPEIDGFIDPRQTPSETQIKVPVEPDMMRIAVLGQELSSTPGVSIVIFTKTDEMGANREMLLYSNKNDYTENALIETGGKGGAKIPPDTGLLLTRWPEEQEG